MPSLKQTLVRNVALPIAYQLGLDRWLRKRGGNPYLILCYHGVDHKSSMPYTGRHISGAVFEKHLQYFRKHFEVVSLQEIFRMHATGVVPTKPTIAITFDDGYENNYSVALPLLEKYQMPASYYISGICVEQPDYVIWADILDVIRVHRAEAGIQYGEYDFRPVGTALWDDTKQKNIYDFIKELPVGERDEVLAEIRAQYKFDALVEKHEVEYFRLMNPEQLKACADSDLIEIGVHGYRHYNLAYIKPEEAASEIGNAKKLLEDCCQQEVLSIAFPDGNYNAKVKDISKELGLRYLLAENYLLANEANEPDILQRVSISGTTNYYSQILFINQQFQQLGF
ncbi:MAG: polysaccharide deacetylase family protein [Bacteroidia bacterium]